MEKFLERHKLPKLAQEVIEHLNRAIPTEETELISLKLPTKKSLDPDGLL